MYCSMGCSLGSSSVCTNSEQWHSGVEALGNHRLGIVAHARLGRRVSFRAGPPRRTPNGVRSIGSMCVLPPSLCILSFPRLQLFPLESHATRTYPLFASPLSFLPTPRTLRTRCIHSLWGRLGMTYSCLNISSLTADRPRNTLKIDLR